MYTGNKAAGGVRNPICCCSYCGYNFCHYVLLTHRRTGSCLSAGLVQKTHILWMLPEIFSGRKYWRLFLTVKSFNWAWQKKILGWKVWSINLNSWNPPNFLSCCPQLQEKCTLFPTPILMLFLAPQIPGEVNYCFSQSDTASTAIVSSPLFHQRSCHVQRWKPLCVFLGCVVPTVALQRENVKGELVKVPLSETRYGRQCKRKIQRAVFVILSVIIAIIIAMITTAFVIL